MVPGTTTPAVGLTSDSTIPEFDTSLGIARTPTMAPTIKTAMPINQKLTFRCEGDLAFLLVLLDLRVLDLRLNSHLPNMAVRDVKPQARLDSTAIT